ncbi:MAG: SDR family oxidoreductase [Thermomicrobiales bacterium]|nr:SDR family oxidoreductase [Thermomicrobiales bacterium]
MRLADRVAVVTGGGSGIGRAISLLFASEGATVIAADLVPERAEETAALIAAAGGTALGVQVDVSKADLVERMIAAATGAYGQVDILVNNAGLSVGNTILDFDEAAWDLNLDVVLKSIYLCSRAVVPGMQARKRGVILNVSSVNGLTAVGESAYSAAKAGMINLTQNMALHFGKDGIRVNCVAPGTIRTPIWGPRVERDPQVFEKIAKWYPLGRVGEPEDIAEAALFLCSDAASWITGVTLPVDGGLTAGPYRFGGDLQG